LTDPAAGGLRRCAVLGHPIAHSLSPVLHRRAYAELGLGWRYDAVDVREPELAGFLDGLDDAWRGLSLTMPLKRTVVALLDELTGEAERARAANTVVLDGGRRVGHNTDVPGAVAALTERHPGPFDRAVVLGGGATAASVLLALADLGCREATLLVRDRGRAGETAEVVARHPQAPRLEVGTLPQAGSPSTHTDVLVSTIPAAAQTEAVLGLVPSAAVAFEVVYDPWPTPLAARAEAAGVPLVTGLDLLVHQAARQVELMTGVTAAPLAAMREAGRAALAARAAPPSGAA
jgi:shikimate dehydrogenase